MNADLKVSLIVLSGAIAISAATVFAGFHNIPVIIVLVLVLNVCVYAARAVDRRSHERGES